MIRLAYLLHMIESKGSRLPSLSKIPPQLQLLENNLVNSFVDLMQKYKIVIFKYWQTYRVF